MIPLRSAAVVPLLALRWRPDAARTVADHLRRAHEGEGEGEGEAVRDPAFQTDVDDLRDGSKPVCDPTEPT